MDYLEGGIQVLKEPDIIDTPKFLLRNELYGR